MDQGQNEMCPLKILANKMEVRFSLYLHFGLTGLFCSVALSESAVADCNGFAQQNSLIKIYAKFTKGANLKQFAQDAQLMEIYQENRDNIFYKHAKLCEQHNREMSNKKARNYIS